MSCLKETKQARGRMTTPYRIGTIVVFSSQSGYVHFSLGLTVIPTKVRQLLVFQACFFGTVAITTEIINSYPGLPGLRIFAFLF